MTNMTSKDEKILMHVNEIIKLINIDTDERKEFIAEKTYGGNRGSLKANPKKAPIYGSRWIGTITEGTKRERKI